MTYWLMTVGYSRSSLRSRGVQNKLSQQVKLAQVDPSLPPEKSVQMWWEKHQYYHKTKKFLDNDKSVDEKRKKERKNCATSAIMATIINDKTSNDIYNRLLMYWGMEDLKTD